MCTRMASLLDLLRWYFNYFQVSLHSVLVWQDASRCKPMQTGGEGRTGGGRSARILSELRNNYSDTPPRSGQYTLLGGAQYTHYILTCCGATSSFKLCHEFLFLQVSVNWAGFHCLNLTGCTFANLGQKLGAVAMLCITVQRPELSGSFGETRQNLHQGKPTGPR